MCVFWGCRQVPYLRGETQIDVSASRRALRFWDTPQRSHTKRCSLHAVTGTNDVGLRGPEGPELVLTYIVVTSTNEVGLLGPERPELVRSMSTNVVKLRGPEEPELVRSCIAVQVSTT